jgi:serine phosphatase RsbU (regulator of sigma subunit)
VGSTERGWLITSAVVTVGLALVDLALGQSINLTSGYFLGPMVAAAAVRPSRTAIIAIAGIGLTLIVGFAEDIAGGELAARALLVSGASVVAVVVAQQRERRDLRLTAAETIAEVAQRAILRPLPARAGAMSFAARYESAEAGARVGGDLFEVVESEWGVRLIVGDVGGHGLPAVRMAASALGSFREMALSLRDPLDIARLLDRRLSPQLGEEGFVTAIITEFRPDGTAVFVNCGHPWPLLVRAGESSGRYAPLADPAPPLGLNPTPLASRVTLEPGDRLLYYTDGLLEAETRVERGIDVTSFAPIMATGALERAMDALLRAIDEMADGKLEDDLALVLTEFSPG